MKLHFKKMGNGHPMIIMHGLYGMSDNWFNIGKKLSEYFAVYLIDLRNHGKSPFSEVHNYNAMTDDLSYFLHEQNINKAAILGHSMGGKVAMNFALRFPGKISNLIVADISPFSYLNTNGTIPESSEHPYIIKTLLEIDLSRFWKREEIEGYLKPSFTNNSLLKFLLKNISRDGDKNFTWSINLDSLKRNLPYIMDKIPELDNAKLPSSGFPILFIKGEKSNYIAEQDIIKIKNIFPNYRFATIKNVSHWLHAENPEAFFNEIIKFVF